MQEEVIDKSVDVAVRIVNLTLTEILKGIEAIISALEKKQAEPTDPAKNPNISKAPALKEGKQTLRELHKHNEGLATIELTNPHLRDLHKSMKKADIDFSCVKDGKGKDTLFFKGKNAEEMTHAFKRYSEKITARADIQAGKKVVRDEKQAKRTEIRAEKKSIRQELKEAKAAAKALDAGRGKEKNKSRGARDR
jgi:hypothetical protein